MTLEERRFLSILAWVESAPGLTQRMLAERLGVALGTANQLVRSLISRRWIKLVPTGRRTRYLLTTAGLAEKRRLRKIRFEETIGDYIGVRNHISASLDNLDKGRPRIVLYGAGDVAQIVYTIVAHSKLELIGVVDDAKAGEKFFDHEIAHPAELEWSDLNGFPFDVVIVASYRHADKIEQSLRRMNFPPSRVFALFD